MEQVSCTAEEAKDCVTGLLDSEIQHLETLRETMTELGDHRINDQKGVRLAPPPETLERLLRYEAHLSREFDRTLGQLERLQQMRLGQPVPPTLKVELSR